MQKFFSQVQIQEKDFPGWLCELNEEAEDELIKESNASGINSAFPWQDTVSVSSYKSDSILINWESRNTTSLLTALKLSTFLPDVEFDLDFESDDFYFKGNILLQNGKVTVVNILDNEISIVSLLIEHGMLQLAVGEEVEVGRGMVFIKCLSAEKEKDGITKTFNVIFQADESPVFKVLIIDDSLESWEYHDNDGNTDIEDNDHAGEMRMDLQ